MRSRASAASPTGPDHRWPRAASCTPPFARPIVLTPTPTALWGRAEWNLERLGVLLLPLDRLGLRAGLGGLCDPGGLGEPRMHLVEAGDNSIVENRFGHLVLQ